MTELVVRRLLVDLETPFARHWNGGDVFRSAYFNALSMSFPIGEQFFIDSVRRGIEALPPSHQLRYQAEVQGFVGQEATHRRIHTLFNSHLERLGYYNHWAEWAAQRIARIHDFDVRHHLALTAAYEHFTAVLAEYLLAWPQQMAQAESRLQLMWSWHAAEEAEHKSTAFDLYQAVGGNYRWRMRWFRFATIYFLVDSMRQTASNLRRDGQLFKWHTWRSAFKFFCGQGGMLRECFKPWCAYFRRGFHPSQYETGRSAAWLREHAAEYVVIGRH